MKLDFQFWRDTLILSCSERWVSTDPMESMSSQMLQKRRPKRKRTQKDPELERLDSLKWNSSIPSDDPLSAFIGSNELEGGLNLFVCSSV